MINKPVFYASHIPSELDFLFCLDCCAITFGVNLKVMWKFSSFSILRQTIATTDTYNGQIRRIFLKVASAKKIFRRNIAPKAQLMIFLFEEKLFRFQDV